MNVCQFIYVLPSLLCLTVFEGGMWDLIVLVPGH